MGFVAQKIGTGTGVFSEQTYSDYSVWAPYSSFYHGHYLIPVFENAVKKNASETHTQTHSFFPLCLWKVVVGECDDDVDDEDDDDDYDDGDNKYEELFLIFRP